MEFAVLAVVIIALIELAYVAGYKRWDCPAKDLHDLLWPR